MAALRDTSEDASGEFDIVSASDCNDVRVEAQTNSAVSDSDESLTTLTLQDAVNKLQELAKENMQLRDCLRRSNEQMKEQCTMLESMQASRVKENATIEARFNQSRIKIASLREQVACLEQCLKQTECERDELRCRIQVLSPSQECAPSLPYPTGDALQETCERSCEEGVRSRDLHNQLSAMLVEVQETRDTIRRLTAEKLLAEQRSLTLETRVKVCEDEMQVMVSQQESDLTNMRRITELEENLRHKELERLELELKLQRLQEMTSAEQTSQSEVSASDYAALQDKLQLEEAIKLSLESALDKRMCELVLVHDDLHRKTAELRECQQKLADSEADSMLLKFQAEVYRSDFAAERSARERVLEKSEAFIERILELEVQVRNLQSGMNGGAQTGPVGQPHPQPAVHWRRQRAGQRGATATDEADGAGLNDPIDDAGMVFFNCPRCQSIFPDFTLLQSHFADCMTQTLLSAD